MRGETAEKPLVSVVLPTYNRAHVLPHAIRGVLQQTYRNVELIIVDDNSQDDTNAVVGYFGDGRIRYLRNETNLKLPCALNRGFSVAKGEFLTWTSDDNIYGERAIETMVEFLQSNDCEFVFADYFDFSELDAETGKPLNVRHEKLPGKVQLEKGNRIGACFMYTRSVYREIGWYDPELFLVEDFDFFLRTAQRFTMCHISEPLYFFRRHEEALYCSRFCEVKAADVLVRHKNGVLSNDQTLNAIVELLLKNIEQLRNPFVRWMYHAVRNSSYRWTSICKKTVALYIDRRLRRNVMEILEAYDSSRSTFGEAKDSLSELMSQVARIEYR